MESKEVLKYQPIFDKTKCIYTACYCEENTWQLCKSLLAESEAIKDKNPGFKSEGFAIFITNKEKKAEIRY